eukprot:CAMPEP_0117554022 /NCGR_PEP_ID=MMETSP0784-20121206/50533_1 /TAXON_ID=39447 /ORGANISM="" /LENGTH=135 /DNA_ID=CAMNT_0005351161 /DNA_START=174 /DNA_END=581 /DNA_ORIENTATION=+
MCVAMNVVMVFQCSAVQVEGIGLIVQQRLQQYLLWRGSDDLGGSEVDLLAAMLFDEWDRRAIDHSSKTGPRDGRHAHGAWLRGGVKFILGSHCVDARRRNRIREVRDGCYLAMPYWVLTGVVAALVDLAGGWINN